MVLPPSLRPPRARRAAALGLAAFAWLLVRAGTVRAQASAPVKDATTNPCQFEASLGRSARCATAGQVVSWSVFAGNPDFGNPMTVTVSDAAPAPAGCFTFQCDPTLFVNGMPVPLPAGSTCDPVTGFTIPNITLPPAGGLRVDFQGTLSGTLAAGDTCANIATITFPFGPVTTQEPNASCLRDVGGVFPTILDICGQPPGDPILTLVKTAETRAGVPMTDIGDGDEVCFRFRVENTGDDGIVSFQDAFDSHFVALDFDPFDPFATGSCGISGNTASCGGIVIAAGGSDEARICGTFQCTNGMTQVGNAAALVVTEPPTGVVVPSRPCASCPTGPTTLGVLVPDFTSSAKTMTLADLDGDGCASVGDRVDFTLTVRNTGTDVASDVLFRDADPTGGSDAGNCEWSVGGGALQPCPAAPPLGFSLGALAAGDPPAVIRWSVDVTAVSPPDDYCDEGCSLSTPECAASWYAPIACVPGCASGPRLRIQKSGWPNAAWPGETVAYLMETCNVGDAPAPSVVVHDLVPSCATYVAGSMTIGPSGGNATALTDVADRDAGTFVAAPAEAIFDVTEFLGRDLAVGECVDLRLEMTALECPGIEPGYWNTPTATIAGDPSAVDVGASFTQVLVPAPAPQLFKVATPSPTVGPGDVINYTLRACNHQSAPADLTDVVVQDEVPACTDYVPGSLRIAARSKTDQTGDDEADFVQVGPSNGTVTFRPGTLAPGECVECTYQVRARLTCGGQLVSNTATLAWGTGGGLVESNLSQVGVATYSLAKTSVDVDGARLVQGDEVEYAVTFCNGSPFSIPNLVVTDAIPGVSVAPPSDCDASYVRDSMTLEIRGNPAVPLTDVADGDGGQTLPGNPTESLQLVVAPMNANECFTLRFRIRVDVACLDGECLDNQAHVTFGSPPTVVDSNVAEACVGAFVDGEPYRAVGFSSMVRTGGCQFGPRLREFACPEIPAICREDAPGTRWIMMGDAVPRGDLVTFYEVPGAGCCAAAPSDASYLVVRKITGTSDAVIEIVWGCP